MPPFRKYGLYAWCHGRAAEGEVLGNARKRRHATPCKGNCEPEARPHSRRSALLGLFAWIKSFNACFWRALTAHVEEGRTAITSSSKRKQKRPTDLFFTLRIHQAVRWTYMLLHGLVKTLEGVPFRVQKWHSLAHRKPAFSHTIRTDASPFGFGAILFEGPWPISWCASVWDDADMGILKALPGNPAWQAEWELFAILIALDLWLPRLRGSAAGVLQSDATAALFASRREAGRSPAMNALCAEIALRLELAAIHLRHEHYGAALNFEADALSRLSQGASVPERLQQIERQHVPLRSFSLFWAWPRELSGEKPSAPAEVETGRGASGNREVRSQHLAPPEGQLSLWARVT